MKIIAIVIFFQLWINNVCAQHNYIYQISLQTDCSMCLLKYSRDLKIDITRIKDQMIISYRVLDSIQTINFKNDPDFEKIKDSMLKLKPQDSDSALLSEIRNLEMKYSFFFKDTLVLGKSGNSELFDYVDLFGEENDTFTDEITTTRTDNILDGNYFHIVIKNQNSMTSKYCVHVLNESRYPITYKLVESLLGVYRKMKPGTLLEKGSKTLNY